MTHMILCVMANQSEIYHTLVGALGHFFFLEAVGNVIIPIDSNSNLFQRD